jgi:hypothetical protein
MGPIDFQFKCNECSTVANKRANSAVEAQEMVAKRYGWERESFYVMLCPDHKKS